MLLLFFLLMSKNFTYKKKKNKFFNFVFKTFNTKKPSIFVFLTSYLTTTFFATLICYITTNVNHFSFKKTN